MHKNKYILCFSYGIGYTKNGEQFLFDLEDFDIIKNYMWTINKGYVTTNYKQHTISMHRLIMQPDDNLTIDHINHNKTDNRKANLRICTQADNLKNKSKSKNNTSGVIGVSWNIKDKRWRAKITKDKKYYFLGNFIYKEDAIKARLRAEQEMFGDFAPQKELFKQYNI